MSQLRRRDAGQGAAGGRLCRPAGLRNPDAAGVAQAPDALYRGRLFQAFVLQDNRIAAKGCLLTTRAAKWATVQVGGGRTVCEVAAELACDWHTVNDAVTIYGAALLGRGPQTADQDSGDRVEQTKFRPARGPPPGQHATTVADVEHHQIIDILPSRNYRDVAAFLDKQPDDWKARIPFGAHALWHP